MGCLCTVVYPTIPYEEHLSLLSQRRFVDGCERSRGVTSERYLHAISTAIQSGIAAAVSRLKDLCRGDGSRIG